VVAGPVLAGPPATADSDVEVIRSAEEARRAVDVLADAHVDFIKVHDGLSRESFLAIADAAKKKGLPFAGHVTAAMTPGEASSLGEKSIEHFEFLPKACLALFDPQARAARRTPAGCDGRSLDALLGLFARNGTWLDPTVQSFQYFAPTQWPAILAGFRDLVSQIRQHRVRLLTGTDWSTFLESKGASPGGSLHDELAVLVDAGFTPLEALRAATLHPAIFLGLSDDLGTVQAGKIADLIVLDANPLQDIRNTKRIAAVIAEGKLIDRGGIDRAR
jgi:imidazolonepropionase-like amidohydrolase